MVEVELVHRGFGLWLFDCSTRRPLIGYALVNVFD